MIIDSIIFDLDGTLWNSTDAVVIAWNEVLKKRKHINKEITKKDLESVMGLQIKDIGKKLFPKLSEDKQLELIKECCDIECQYICRQGGVLYEGVEKTLSILSKKYKLFIVSNCQKGYIEAFYEYHKLDKLFIDYENPGRTGLTKGENIKLIIERNNLVNAIYVGDTEGDLIAARKAGIPFVYAKYGFGNVKEWDFSLDSFSQLTELVNL